MLGSNEHKLENLSSLSTHLNGQVNGEDIMTRLRQDEETTNVASSATLRKNQNKESEGQETYNLCWKEFANNLGSFFR